jgi:hypothetical protein
MVFSKLMQEFVGQDFAVIALNGQLPSHVWYPDGHGNPKSV